MKKNFVVIGLGKFGYSVARALFDIGHDVLAVDEKLDLVEAISPYVTRAVKADATDKNTLQQLGINNMDVVIIGMGVNIKASILVTALCKEIGAKIVVSKALDELHGKILSMVGADRVVFPEREMGIRLAQSLSFTNVLECIELSEKYSIVEIEVLKKWDGHTIGELDLRKKYGINVMAIKGDGNKISINPLGEDVLHYKDTLVIIGSIVDIQNLDHTTCKRENGPY